MLDFDRFEWVSFDCYGTLVDWETGIAAAIRRVLDAHGTGRSQAEILALYADTEPGVQASQPFLSYRDVLRGVMEAVAARLDFQCTESELDCLNDSLPHWPVFPEVVDALRALSTRYKLAIISNVDDDLFGGTADALGVDFEVIVTSQQVGCYKPDLRNFKAASARMAVSKQRWLHVAESLHHDIGPANQLGITSVWVNRAGSGGATRHTDAVPDLVVSDLSALARMAIPPCAAQ